MIRKTIFQSTSIDRIGISEIENMYPVSIEL